MAKQCEMAIGFLLPRRCEEKAQTLCKNCKRNVCDHHTRIGDPGLLCRDCHEEGQPRLIEDIQPLAEPVRRTIYTRSDFGMFDDEDADDTFSVLS